MAARAGRLRRQAGRRDRHRRDRRADHPDHRGKKSATSPCSSARRTGARRCTTARSTPRRRRSIKAGYPEMFARCQETFACFMHTPDPRGAFEVSDEEREAFYEKLYAERGFGIWQGNFRDILTDRKANATDQRFRRAKNPPAREGPEGRRKADPEEPRLRHPAAAARDLLLRGLQPGQCRAGGHHGNADRADHAEGIKTSASGIRVRHHHLRDRLRRHHRQPSTGSTSAASMASG